MSVHSVPVFSFDFLTSRTLDVEVSDAPLTSDAGLIPIRHFDQHIRLTEQVADALHDRRDPTLTRQSVLSMVRQRIYGILGDYEDQNDHDSLRSDPVFKLIADRLPDDPDLASQPTLPLAVRERRFDRRADLCLAAPRRPRRPVPPIVRRPARASHARPRRLRRHHRRSAATLLLPRLFARRAMTS